jgi:hypothetical protein
MRKSKPMSVYSYKQHTINIYYDENPENNPRKHDNLGTILYSSNKILYSNHKAYRELCSGGDKAADWAEIEEMQKSDNCSCLPVYGAVTMNGIVLSTNPIGGFSESGKCGIIHSTKRNLDLMKGSYHSFHKDSKSLLSSFSDYDWAISVFKKEIRVFSDFLEGRVYGYEIENTSGEVLDSCWGYIGVDIKEIYYEAKEIIDKCYSENEEPIEQFY